MQDHFSKHCTPQLGRGMAWCRQRGQPGNPQCCGPLKYDWSRGWVFEHNCPVMAIDPAGWKNRTKTNKKEVIAAVSNGCWACPRCSLNAEHPIASYCTQDVVDRMMEQHFHEGPLPPPNQPAASSDSGQAGASGPTGEMLQRQVEMLQRQVEMLQRQVDELTQRVEMLQLQVETPGGDHCWGSGQ